jgi:uncharacterized membrane protein YgcG
MIMDNELVPYFKVGNFDIGVTSAVNALIGRLETANVAAGPVSPYCVALMKEAA